MADAWFLRSSGNSSERVDLTAPIVMTGADRVESDGYVEFKVALRDNINALSAESTGGRITVNRVSGLFIYSMSTGVELRFDNAEAIPDLGVGGIYKIKIDTQAGNFDHTLSVNDVVIGTKVPTSGLLSLSKIFEQGANNADMDLYYWHMVDRRTPSNSFYYEATESGGTGSVLTDTSANANNGTLVNFPTDDSQWILYDDGITSASIVDVDTDNTVVDGQQNVSLTTTGFASDITTVNLKVGADTLVLTGLTGTGDNYTFDLPDVTSYTGITAGLPFSSGTYQNEIQVGDGTDTAVINITREPKAGYAVVEVASGVSTTGSIFETRSGGAPADGSQVYYPTADATSIDATGVITTDSTGFTAFVWDVASGDWDVVTFVGATAGIPLEYRDNFRLLNNYLLTQGRTSSAIDNINDWLVSEGFSGSLNDKMYAYLGSLGYTGSLMDRLRAWELS